MSEEIKPLSIDELIAAKRPLKRTMVFENEQGEEVKRYVVFRRLSFAEIMTLEDLPSDKAGSLKFVQYIIKIASVEPKFDSPEITGSFPSGFIRSYSELILLESGRDPFLKKK